MLAVDRPNERMDRPQVERLAQALQAAFPDDWVTVEQSPTKDSSYLVEFQAGNEGAAYYAVPVAWLERIIGGIGQVAD